MAITRLELLKKEKEIVKGLKCLSYNLGAEVLSYYDVEINAIEVYGSINPTYNDETDDDMK